MRKKIITLVLCFSIAISPSLANSYQINNPDPEFLGDFMVYNFLTSQFNLEESYYREGKKQSKTTGWDKDGNKTHESQFVDGKQQ